MVCYQVQQHLLLDPILIKGLDLLLPLCKTEDSDEAIDISLGVVLKGYLFKMLIRKVPELRHGRWILV